jgi:hypothetical protein
MDSGMKALSEDPVWAEASQRVLQALGVEVVGEPQTYGVTTKI